MTRRRASITAVCFGLAVAEAIAALHVFLSNHHLFRQLELVRDAGYLTVPNDLVRPTLLGIAPVFYGGLFFTGSIGLGLTLAALAAARLWAGPVQRSRLGLGLCLVFWLVILAAVNGNGFSPLAGSYVLLIPLTVFYVAVRPWSGVPEAKERWSLAAPGIALALLALLWLPRIGDYFFLEVRDNLLLSNPIGRAINDFYYHYTLYPAQAFKSLEQKTIRTCTIDGVGPSDRTRLAVLLVRHDWLPVPSGNEMDLDLATKGDSLTLMHLGKTIMAVPLARFLAAPGPVLADFSRRVDRFALFRAMTFVSLAFGLPLAVFGLFYGLLHAMAIRMVGQRMASLSAAAIALAIGAALLIPWGRGTLSEAEMQAPLALLTAADSLKRTAALRFMVLNGIDAGGRIDTAAINGRPRIAERYWYVQGLAGSRQPDATEQLRTFLYDPHPNIVCMAFGALGRRGDRKNLPLLLDRFAASDHWYEQWYGYRALRALGWTQAGKKSR